MAGAGAGEGCPSAIPQGTAGPGRQCSIMEHVQTQVLPSPLPRTAPPPSFRCHFFPVPTEHASGPGFHFLPQGLLSMSIGAGFICGSRLSQKTIQTET